MSDTANSEIDRLTNQVKKLQAALAPFAIAKDIAKRALGEWTDRDHLHAVALLYLKPEHLDAAAIASKQED